jgi:hypothetical protein
MLRSFVVVNPFVPSKTADAEDVSSVAQHDAFPNLTIESIHIQREMTSDN